MGKLKNALSGILKRGGLAFTAFPASMAFALLLAGLSIWLIYAEPETNERLWTSLLFSFAAASVVGIAFSTASRVFSGRSHDFTIANIAAVVYSGVAFILLIFVRGDQTSPEPRVLIWVTGSAVIGLFAFLAIPSFRDKLIDYNQMFFMTIKSFFIALLYSGVLMAGFSFVAFAVERLLWEDLNEKVYMYILVISLLVGYAFFLGYFPDFRKRDTDGYSERTQIAVKQPRFAEILFQNIMIPIVAALSVVLLAWSIKIVMTGDWPVFTQIAGIFTAYSLSSIVLYLLVSSYDTKIVRLYKKINPIATLVFLGFEAYPIYSRLAAEGLKLLEYMVILLWIFAAIISLCFIFLPVVKNRVVSYVAAALVLVLMLPVTGVIDAPFYSQSARLRRVLQRNDMLNGDTIIPKSNIPVEDQFTITDAASFLYFGSEREAPLWLKGNLSDMTDFRQVFGFDEKYDRDTDPGPEKPSKYLNLNLERGAVDVEGYAYFIPGQVLESSGEVPVGSGSEQYTVLLVYDNKEEGRLPFLWVSQDGRQVIETDFVEFTEDQFDKYFGTSESGSGKDLVHELSEGELSFTITADDFEVKIVISSIEYYLVDGEIDYINLSVYGVCIK